MGSTCPAGVPSVAAWFQKKMDAGTKDPPLMTLSSPSNQSPCIFQLPISASFCARPASTGSRFPSFGLTRCFRALDDLPSSAGQSQLRSSSKQFGQAAGGVPPHFRFLDRHYPRFKCCFRDGNEMVGPTGRHALRALFILFRSHVVPSERFDSGPSRSRTNPVEGPASALVLKVNGLDWSEGEV